MEAGSIIDFFLALPTDWIIIGSFALIMFVDALRVGSARISTLAVSAIVSMVIYGTVASAALFGPVSAQLSTPVLQAAFFSVIYILSYILVRRVFIDYGELHGQPLQAIFAAVAVTALIVVVWLQIPALSAVWQFGEQVQAVFGEAYRFWWMLVSLAALAFAKA